MTTAPAPSASPFAVRLRRWRSQRAISQLALAGRVGSTSRHISFLETGRSRPSRQMVLRLCEGLELSLRDRNDLLQAAGLAPAYPQAQLEGADLAPYRAAIEQLLRAHEPFPATVLDGHWDIVAANRAALLLLGEHAVGTNVVRRFVIDPAAPELIANWTDVAVATLHRLRQESARTPFDDTLTELLAGVEEILRGVVHRDDPSGSLVVCPWFRIDGTVVRTIGMVARFDPAAEVTLDELRVELTYPQDATAERFFRDRAAPPTD